MYCVKCRKHTETLNITTFTTRNGRLMRKGICADCGKAKTQFIKTGSGLFNKAVSKLSRCTCLDTILLVPVHD